MKLFTKMTNAQSAEINMLRVSHSEALTAFYDEGMSRGAKAVLQGALIGGAIIMGVEIVGIVRSSRKS